MWLLWLSLTNHLSSAKPLTYVIKTTWDNRPINHDPAKITLSWKPNDDFITAEFEAVYFDDPAPQGPRGQPFPQLWNYEGLYPFICIKNHAMKRLSTRAFVFVN